MAPRNPAAERKARTVKIDNVMDSTTTAAAPEPVIAPEGTSVPQQVVALPESTAAAVLADEVGNSKPVTVPAPKTPAQLAADEFIGTVKALWSSYYGKRPQGSEAFVEPDKAALKAMRLEYITAHNAAHADQQLDATDMDDQITAALAVKESVDAQRAAHAAAAANQQKVDQEWARASYTVLHDLTAAIKLLSGTVRTTTSSNDGDEPKERKARQSSSEKWSTWAPAMYAAAKKLGLDGVYLLDITAGGYKGQYHALLVREDGTLERCEYNPTNRTFKRTGTIVSTWRFFGKEGVSYDDQPKQDRINHDLFGKDEMFGIAMVNKDGGIVDVDGLTADLRDDKGARKPGSLKPFAMFSTFMAYAGINYR